MVAWSLAVKLLSEIATEPYWWSVNIGLGSDLVQPGNKPLPDQMFI